MVAALKMLGFDGVFDTNFAADLTIMEEATEFLGRLNKGENLPLITSCSPGWIKFCEHYYPEFIPNLSSCKSPQGMFGSVAKTYYAQKEGIDPENIFLVGHSMGGMLSPRIDAEGGNFRGLIIMAGSPRKLEEIMLDQNEAVLRSTKGLVHWIVKKQVAKISKLFEGLYEISDEEARKKKMGGGTTLYYFKEMGEHAAPQYLKQLQKPLLILQGEKDVQVKVDKDFAAYQALLADKPLVSFKLYENLNHAFVPSVYGSLAKANKEYATEQHISETVIADIADWILCVSPRTSGRG
jgi:dienelactone hydrolase